MVNQALLNVFLCYVYFCFLMYGVRNCFGCCVWDLAMARMVVIARGSAWEFIKEWNGMEMNGMKWNVFK